MCGNITIIGGMLSYDIDFDIYYLATVLGCEEIILIAELSFEAIWRKF